MVATPLAVVEGEKEPQELKLHVALHVTPWLLGSLPTTALNVDVSPTCTERAADDMVTPRPVEGLGVPTAPTQLAIPVTIPAIKHTSTAVLSLPARG